MSPGCPSMSTADCNWHLLTIVIPMHEELENGHDLTTQPQLTVDTGGAKRAETS